jgi:two-component sensor histidine kinase
VVDRTVGEVFPSFERDWLEIYGRVAGTGIAERNENFVQDVDRWYRVHHFRLGGPGSRHAALVLEDISDRKRVEIALRETQGRQAFLLKLSDALRPLVDPSGIQCEACRILREHLGAARVNYAEAQGHGDMVITALDAVPGLPELLGRRLVIADHGAGLEHEFRAGKATWRDDVQADACFTSAEKEAHVALGVRAWANAPLVKDGALVAMLNAQFRGAHAWTPAEIALLDETAERTWEAVQRARAEARQVTLSHELQHRVRNILGMVRAIIRRSARNARTVQEMVKILDGRMNALARTQVLLTRAAGSGVDLDTIVREELLPYTGPESQVSLCGPPILLMPATAEILTLAVHELATNATKYGAIAHKGSLAVTWQTEAEAGVDWLVFQWVEDGVDIPERGHRKGFGTELIERRVPYELHGHSHIDLGPTGLHARIAFPLVPGESVFVP